MVQPGTDGFGVGVGELVEDSQGLLVGVAGGLEVACGALGVALAGEGVGFVVTSAKFSEQLDRLPVAVEGLGVMAKVTVGEAEAVPSGRLPLAITRLLEQGQSLLAAVQGLLVVAE